MAMNGVIDNDRFNVHMVIWNSFGGDVITIACTLLFGLLI